MRLAPGLRRGSRCRLLRIRCCEWLPPLPARLQRRRRACWGWMTGRGDGATATARCWLTSREMRLWTCCRTGKLQRSLPGYAPTLGSRSSPVIGAGTYADGIRQGAPDAVQVADGWHLLRNLGDAVQALADKHSAAGGRAAHHVRAHLRASGATIRPRASPIVSPKPTAAERVSAASRARRQSLYEEAARLRAAGASIKRIAAELGAERKTVRRWLRLGHAPLGSSRRAAACSIPSSSS